MTEKLDRTSGLFAIILAPTRELSTQIYAVMEKVRMCCHWLVPGIVVGGEKKKAEKARIRKGINVLVATPGRLVDHFDNTESLDLSNVRWLILDEGDRLMELGFEEDIKHIISTLDKASAVVNTAHVHPTLPKRRITVLCSATMKGNVRKLGDTSLTDAQWVTADKVKDEETTRNAQHVAPAQLVQQYVVVPAKLRLVTLAAILKSLATKNPTARIMVFFSCTDSVDFHFTAFTRGGASPGKATIPSVDEDDGEDVASNTILTSPLLGNKAVVYKLHGSLSQKLRTSTMTAFSSPTFDAAPSILFCTDVASRGLDLPSISNVVEFDPPFSLEDHIHRVGRTARAGHVGSSILFLLPGKEEEYVNVIQSAHPGGLTYKSYETLLKDAFGNKWDVDATTWHLDAERWLIEDSHSLDLAKRAFTSHIRAYATHLALERSIFDMKALHFGHIAKSFALRETPASISSRHSSGKSNGNPKKHSKAIDFKDPRAHMLSMARKHQAMSEFNLG
jgi:ATP-dependent RNA helicase DDX31/DBP7